MMKNTAVLEKNGSPKDLNSQALSKKVAASFLAGAQQTSGGAEPLLREALGKTLRDMRVSDKMTLRDLARVAQVSPGYLSELERGRKEVSSELLASICDALNVSVAHVMLESASMMALDSAAAELTAKMNQHADTSRFSS